VLYVRRLILHENIVKKYQALLSAGKKALYPIRQADLRTLQIPSSVTTFTSDIVYNTIPQYMIMCLITPTQLLGKISQGPFDFQSHSLASASVLLDSELSSFREIKIDTSNNRYILGYQSLFQALPNRFLGNGIKREDYPNKCIIVFELLPQRLDSCFSINKKGQLKIELRFNSSTSEPLLCLLLSSFESTLSIDSSRNANNGQFYCSSIIAYNLKRDQDKNI
jgi:hypothetical protein